MTKALPAGAERTTASGIGTACVVDIGGRSASSSGRVSITCTCSGSADKRPRQRVADMARAET